MLDIVYREETLSNVIKSVTKNSRSILLTAFLAVILIYLFSILGYIFFQNDFLMEVDPLPGLGVESFGKYHTMFLDTMFSDHIFVDTMFVDTMFVSTWGQNEW